MNTYRIPVLGSFIVIDAPDPLTAWRTLLAGVEDVRAQDVRAQAVLEGSRFEDDDQTGYRYDAAREEAGCDDA